MVRRARVSSSRRASLNWAPRCSTSASSPSRSRVRWRLARSPRQAHRAMAKQNSTNNAISRVALACQTRKAVLADMATRTVRSGRASSRATTIMPSESRAAAGRANDAVWPGATATTWPSRCTTASDAVSPTSTESRKVARVAARSRVSTMRRSGPPPSDATGRPARIRARRPRLSRKGGAIAMAPPRLECRRSQASCSGGAIRAPARARGSLPSSSTPMARISGKAVIRSPSRSAKPALRSWPAATAAATSPSRASMPRDRPLTCCSMVWPKVVAISRAPASACRWLRHSDPARTAPRHTASARASHGTFGNRCFEPNGPTFGRLSTGDPRRNPS